jgi:hypothetical protein
MRLATLALSLLLVSGCGGHGEDAGPVNPAGETPEATWKVLRTAVLAGDWGTVYDLHPPAERTWAEGV